jgi:hypothetical protein
LRGVVRDARLGAAVAAETLEGRADGMQSSRFVVGYAKSAAPSLSEDLASARQTVKISY